MPHTFLYKLVNFKMILKSGKYVQLLKITYDLQDTFITIKCFHGVRGIRFYKYIKKIVY